MGAFTRAAEVVDKARQLDKADRYMNSKVREEQRKGGKNQAFFGKT